MNGTETIAEAGPYPYTSAHDGNAHRMRAPSPTGFRNEA